MFSFTAISAGAQKSCAGSESATVHLKTWDFPVQKVRDAVLFRAGMQIDADGAPNAYGPRNKGLDFIANAKRGEKFVGVITDTGGTPIVQKRGRYKGFYVSPTSLYAAGGSETKPSTFVDARKVPYIALPRGLAEQFGVKLGDLAVVINQKNGRSAFAIYADSGPADKIGEGSVALANALRVNSDPRHGGIQEDVITYLVFPRSGLGQGKLRTVRDIQHSAGRLFRQWGGARRLQSCLLEK
jgi:hypothetical protein